MIEIMSTRDHSCLAELNKIVQNWHAENYPDIFKAHDQAGTELFFKSALNDPNTSAFVAMVENEPVGYVLLMHITLPENVFQYERSFLQLDQLAVKKEYRGMGIGTKLLNRAVEYAKANQLHTIELSHWELNDLAKSLFVKAGFTYYFHKMSLDITD